MRSAFTLIELLVVIAVVAILAVVVVLTLSPTELLRQSRDAVRLSEVGSLNKALALLQLGASSASLGSASTTYISIPDSSPTCANLGLPALPSGWSYACAATSTYRNVDGTGWIPVDFTQASFKSSLGQLPVDPINSTSSRNYYTYTISSNKWKLTSKLESQKQARQTNEGGPDPSIYEAGINLDQANFLGGMISWWKFDEGSGATAADSSGWNKTGTISQSSIYSTSNCKTGGGCLSIPGTNLYYAYTAASPAYNFTNSDFTITLWEYPNVIAQNVAAGGNNNSGTACQSFGGWLLLSSGSFIWCTPAQIGVATQGSSLSMSGVAANTWNFITVSFSSSGQIKLYLNGDLKNSATSNGIGYPAANAKIAIGCQDNGYNCANALIDDFRIYNRALSDAEIRSIYEATK